MISINGKPINTTRFPDNTSQVWKLDGFEDLQHVKVVWEYSHEAEIIELAQLKLLLNCNAISAELDIKYLPYARQDKEVSNHSTFALRVFANILNNMNWYRVSIQDPHSEVYRLINHSAGYYPIAELAQVFKITESRLLCYPDAGALKKYTKIYKDYSFVSADKVREPLTGEITGMELNGKEFVKGENVLIVDDICDGGRTFIELAKLLYAAGAKEVNLFVTHGLFTKGLVGLRDAGIKQIYTQKGLVFKDRIQGGVAFQPFGEIK